MSKLDELIEEFCPDGVEYVKLGEILKNNNATNSIPKKKYKDIGIIPIIDQSQSYIAGYTDDDSAIPPILPSIIFGDHTRVVKYADKEFAQGDSGTKVFIPINETLITKYIYYAFANLDIPSRGYNRHWSIVKDMQIPLPPIPVQREIVRILDNFTELTTELTEELTARQKQYEYYRDKLLTFGKNTIVNWMKIGEFAECYTGATPKTQTREYWDNGTIPWMSSGEVNLGQVYDTEKKITKAGYDNCSTKMVPANTVVVALAGQGKTRGMVAITRIPLCTNQSLCSIVPNEQINSNYLYYYLKTQYQNLRFISSGDGTRGGLNLKMIRNYSVPVPPLEEQERIVAILDRFDALCNDLTSGLPAEIEARKKQYEYYRDKLLSFKEMKS